MRKVLGVVLLMAATGVAAVTANNAPRNSLLIFEDSVRVDSIGTAYKMPACWQDDGGNKAVLVEARDDSSAGFASDSAVVKIEVLQVFPAKKALVKGQDQYLVLLGSHAHPDSTTLAGYRSATFNLWDSLNIKGGMDTAAVYLRNKVQRDTLLHWSAATGYVYGDSAKTVQAASSGFGAFAYTALPFDYSPAVIFKITGLTGNKAKGPGSLWRIRVYQTAGVPTKGN